MKKTSVDKSPNSVDKSPKYWLSLEQWSQDPEFQRLAENEFVSSSFSENGDMGGTARRTFLKLMGASIALSSFGCVRRPAQKIVPYVSRPEDVTPGVANYYASSLMDGSEGFGIVVTTREGRPIKIEGNPDHPMNRGGMSARAHAHLLSLYDPERISGPKQNLLNDSRSNRDTIRTTWKKVDEVMKRQMSRGGVALLTGNMASPSTKKLIDELRTDKGVRHYTWEPITFDDHFEANEKSYGHPVVARPRFDKADYIVSVDADFLGTYLSPTEFSRDFAHGRKKLEHGMNRLVVFESLMSLTGSNADQRFQIKPSQRLDVVMSLVYEIVIKQGLSNHSKDPLVRQALQPYAHVSSILGLGASRLRAVARELWKHRGRSLVLAGGLPTQRGVGLQIAVNFLNSVLGNEGQTVDATHPYTNIQSRSRDLSVLIKRMNVGEVKTLIIHGTNPCYGAPDQMGFNEAIKNVEMVVYTGDRVDETGAMAHYVLPDHHPMENWGDAEFQRGVYSIQQPTIRPMNETRAFQDNLLKWMGREISWYDFLRSHWKNHIFKSGSLGKFLKYSDEHFAGGSFESAWTNLLQKGVWEAEGQSISPRKFLTSALGFLQIQRPQRGIELALYASSGLRDGSMANVSWLQEFPDPVTKICWDNYATVSIKMAHDKNLHEGDVIQLKVSEGNFVTVPVHIQPGQHGSVIGLAIGYGRWAAGEVANQVGVRAYGLVSYEKGQGVFAGRSVEIKKTNRHIALAGTQSHHSMEARQIVVEATLDQYKANPSANIHRHKIFNLWSGHEYKGYKWAMSVDLNSCTGCGACMVACQSENNIPTVGKKHLLNGREMHWIRVDRYYVGDPKDPSAVHMPVMCQHCDNAPCETVCPVVATVHSEEGTNDMIYNRCVGTRYCANNCPYKVRRFNWFKYNDIPSPLNLALNPEVTLRSRGVMEKCTFCNHRIKEVKHRVRLEGNRKIADGEIQTACEQSCPTQAIVFGDMNDKNSRVSREHGKANSYSLLEELNNVPAVRYLSKIRHTNQLKSSHDNHGGHGSHEGHGSRSSHGSHGGHDSHGGHGSRSSHGSHGGHDSHGGHGSRSSHSSHGDHGSRSSHDSHGGHS